MNAYISGSSYYLPESTLSNIVLNEKFPMWSVDKISEKTGIVNRHITNENEFTSDLAIQACEKLFSEHNINKDEIDFVILCTQSPDYFLPTTACVIQDRLSLRKNIGAFDFNLGCSGYVYGLGIAKGLLFSGAAKNVLLITSETYSKFIHPSDKSNLTIFGDGATATLVTSVKSDKMQGELLETIYGTDGSGYDKLIVKRGGIKFPKIEQDDTFDEFGNVRNDNFLYMDGREIFTFTIRVVPTLIKQTLEKNKLENKDIDLFIFHQANRFMLNHLRTSLKIEEERFYIFMENCGNTVSNTIPIALTEAIGQGRIKEGMKVMFVGFGVGLSWGATVVQF